MQMQNKVTIPTFADMLANLGIKNPEMTVYELMEIVGFTEAVEGTYASDEIGKKVLFVGMKKLLLMEISAAEIYQIDSEAAADALIDFVAETEYKKALKG